MDWAHFMSHTDEPRDEKMVIKYKKGNSKCLHYIQFASPS